MTVLIGRLLRRTSGIARNLGKHHTSIRIANGPGKDLTITFTVGPVPVLLGPVKIAKLKVILPDSKLAVPT